MFSVVLVISIIGFWQTEGFVANYIDKTGACPDDFEKLADICYYFSFEKLPSKTTNWLGAKTACENLAPGYTVGLAELGNEATWQSDGLMLERISKQVKPTWLGGKYDDSKGKWMWVYSKRDLSTKNSAWSLTQPEGNKKCLATVIEGPSPMNHRAYLSNALCSNQHIMLNYVCQLF